MSGEGYRIECGWCGRIMQQGLLLASVVEGYCGCSKDDDPGPATPPGIAELLGRRSNMTVEEYRNYLKEPDLHDMVPGPPVTVSEGEIASTRSE